jgi:hypothetical protein
MRYRREPQGRTITASRSSVGLLFVAACLGSACGRRDGDQPLGHPQAASDPSPTIDATIARARRVPASPESVAVSAPQDATALAKTCIERAENDDERRLLQIAWPTYPPADLPAEFFVEWQHRAPDGPPMFGAEGVRRVERRDGRATGAEMIPATLRMRPRYWRKRPILETSSRSFEIDASSLRRAWDATQIVLGARVSGVEREGGGGHDHFTGDFLCIRRGDAPTPVFRSGFEWCLFLNGRVREWDQIQASAVIGVWNDLLRDANSTPSAPETWAAFAEREVRRAAADGGPVDRFTPEQVLGTWNIRIAGEYGSIDTMDAIERLASDELLRTSALTAKTILRLRSRWDADEAATLLRADLAGTPQPACEWINVRLAAADPDAYRALHVDAARHQRPGDADAVRRVLGPLVRFGGDAGIATVRKLLDDTSVEVRAGAALTLLEDFDDDDAALAVLEPIAVDVSLPVAVRDVGPQNTARGAAIAWMSDGVRGDRWWSEERRESEARRPGQDGTVIRFLVDKLDGWDELPRERRIAVWRNGLDSRSELGLADTIGALLALDDRESRERLVAAVTRLRRSVGDLDAAAIDEWTSRLDAWSR